MNILLCAGEAPSPVYSGKESSVDEKALDKNGEVELNKLNPISYDPASRSYFTMGEKVGKAFAIGAKLK